MTASDHKNICKNHICKWLWRWNCSVNCQPLLSRSASFYFYSPCQPDHSANDAWLSHLLPTLTSQLILSKRQALPDSIIKKRNWFFGATSSWNFAILHMLGAWFTLIRTAIYGPFFNQASLVFTLNRLKSDTNCHPSVKKCYLFTIRFIPQYWEIRYVVDNNQSRSTFQGWWQPTVRTITNCVF